MAPREAVNYREIENQTTLAALTSKVHIARTDYAHLSAERGRRGLHVDKLFRKKPVADAKQLCSFHKLSVADWVTYTAV